MGGRRSRAPWYADGLSFECTRCGACCTGAPGDVWVSPEEIAALAEHRGESIDDFSMKFVRKVGRRYSLIERPGGDCIFWERGAGCTVYQARPAQCRTENVEPREDWRRVSEICPGSGKGRHYSVEEIITSIGMVRP